MEISCCLDCIYLFKIMCGIAGILKLDGATLPNQALTAVKSMTDSMSHRGPDGEGQWLAGPVCLGHRRLSIIDLAGGEQPMLDYDRNVCIVFNGEIYNYRELKKDFAEKGFRFYTNSDTEVILAAWNYYGQDCLQYLEGMFAFALWDKEKKVLFAARDQFGKKPFYYSIQNGYFIFASELNAFSVLTDTNFPSYFSLHADPLAIMRYLAYEYVPVPQTIYSEIYSLEPSHCLLVKEGEIDVSRWWEMPAPFPVMPLPEAEAERQLYDLMKRSVRMRMVSDVPLGVFLSGGIDSSIVAGLMAIQSDKPIRTFSIGFREASYDESSYARHVADYFHTDHYEKILSADECANKLPEIASRMDTPMADASNAPTWLLSQLAREHVTVALGGDGADELWAGYEHYIGFRLAIIYNKLPAFLRKRIIEPLCKLLPASAGYINPRLAVKTFLAGAQAPDWLRVQTMLTAIDYQEQKKLLTQKWQNKFGVPEDCLFEPTRRHFEHWLKMPGISPLARAFHVYIRQFMLDDILVKVDRCSMIHSLEVRAPFLDKKTSEFVARLPINCKLHGFKRKYLLKKAFASLLPEKILKRNKRGFQIPVAEWLRGRLKPLLQEMLSADRLEKQGIFNAARAAQLMEEHFSGRMDLRKPLWTLLVFQLWWEAHKPSL